MANTFNHKFLSEFTYVKSKISIQDDTEVSIRQIPYPYFSILSICSDLDETPDRDTYFETARFMNTTENTIMGPGVGLEVGNTIYFNMPQNQFSYWNTDDKGRAAIHQLIRSGHIDCLHSFGDLAITRRHALEALEELVKHDCHLKVWVDHGTAPSNFDGDIMQGSGDVPGSPVYHADQTLDYGIKYVWRGRVTSTIGQNIPKNLAGIWTFMHPLVSGNTILKEFAKGFLAQMGNKKYAMHMKNNIIRPSCLRDNQKIYEFMRCNPHWGGVSCCETAAGFSSVISNIFLNKLIERSGSCILYTHLGKKLDHFRFLPPKTINAFRLLSSYSIDKKILITTTYRQLKYHQMLNSISLSTISLAEKIIIECKYTGPDNHLDGLSFELATSKELVFVINGKTKSLIISDLPDGKKVAVIPWKRLEYPQIN